MIRHTPRPWRVGAYDIKAVAFDIHASARSKFDICLIVVAGRTKKEALANACLVAAAPDMLAALEGLLRTNNSNLLGGDEEGHRLAVEAAYTAIAFATGKERHP